MPVLQLLPRDLIPVVYGYLALRDLQNVEEAMNKHLRVALRSVWENVFIAAPDPLDQESIAFIDRTGVQIVNIFLKDPLSLGAIKTLSCCAECVAIIAIQKSEKLGAWFTDEMLIVLATSCSNLTYVSLVECTNITARSVCVLAKHCPSIKNLLLPENAISDDALIAISNHCKVLEELDLFNPSTLTQNALLALALGCVNLKSIFVSQLLPVTHLHLVDMVRHTPHLIKLEANLWTTNDTLLQAISEHCHNIQTLRFCGAMDVTSVGLSSIANKCKQLLEVHLIGTTQDINEGVQQLANACPQLKKVGLIRCSKLNDSSVEVLVQKCSQLSLLYINDTMFPLCGMMLTDASLLSIAQHTPQLQFLRCGGNSLTDRGVCSLAARCQDLVELSLSCTSITDTALISIADNCTKLQDINVAFCENITDVGVDILVTKCNCLRVLNLRQCNTLTDMSLEAMSHNDALSLKTLNIVSCSKMTMATILRLLKKMTSLSELSVRSTRHQLIKKCRKRFPRVAIKAIDTTTSVIQPL